MTRKNLVDLIYHNSDMWSCPKKKCNDYSSKKCRKCAEELLAKYERKFYNKGYRDGVEAATQVQGHLVFFDNESEE